MATSSRYGFNGGVRVVTEWAPRQRRYEKAGVALSRTAPPARLLSRLMTARRDQLSKADAVTVAAIEAGVPALRPHAILWTGFIACSGAAMPAHWRRG
jgi:hypothetical protein